MPVELYDKALTTLEAVKEELRIADENTDNDNLLTRYINTASEFVQRQMDRCLGQVSYTGVRMSGSRAQKLYTPEWPIVTVENIELNDTDLDVTNNDYEVIDVGKESSYIYRECVWGSRGPCIGITGDRNYMDDLNITIDYTAGYILPKDEGDPAPVRTLPWDIEDLVIRLVSQQFKLHCGDAHGQKDYNVGKRKITWDKLMSDDDWIVIRSYSRYEVV